MSEEKKWYEGDYSKEDVGAILKQLREEELGMSVEEVAEKLAVRDYNVAASEAGKGIHGPNILRKLCDAYGYHLSLRVELK